MNNECSVTSLDIRHVSELLPFVVELGIIHFTQRSLVLEKSKLDLYCLQSYSPLLFV